MSGTARAQSSGGVLTECSALSPLLDDIHACLDDYLAVMDDRLAEIAELVDRTLDGKARTAFVVSQRAFATYRKDNCLWYLAFSTPRNEAEQIGKNCLATMSLQRLSELQRLLTENGGDAPKSGYYTYGIERNTFRPCGSEARYWVEGTAPVVGELQRRYEEVAAGELMVLFVSLGGSLDEAVAPRVGHAGVFRAGAVLDVRMPRDGDCRLSGGTTSPTAVNVAPDDEEEVPEAPVEPPVEPGVPAPEPPPVPGIADIALEEELIAYFGAWLAACDEDSGQRVCMLTTNFAGGAVGDSAVTLGNGVETVAPVLGLTRRVGESTGLELAIPGREIDSPARLRWSVDNFVLGDIIGAAIRVDQRATRLIVDASPFLDEELLPLMIGGQALFVEVLETVDDEEGERYRATLIGLSRALAFADEYVDEGDGS